MNFRSMLLLASIGKAPAWTPSTYGAAASRRTFLDNAAKLVPLVVASPAFADDEAVAVVESVATEEPPENPSPTSTETDEASEENAFIARLKANSEANKDAYRKQAQRGVKLNNDQFSSQYKRPKYFGVRKQDGSFQMVLKAELEKLMTDGKVELTYDTKYIGKSGKVKSDLSKKVYAYTN